MTPELRFRHEGKNATLKPGGPIGPGGPGGPCTKTVTETNGDSIRL